MADAGSGGASNLNEIMTLVARALELADETEEFVLGAKLSDVLFCARTRLASLPRGD